MKRSAALTITKASRGTAIMTTKASRGDGGWQVWIEYVFISRILQEVVGIQDDLEFLVPIKYLLTSRDWKICMRPDWRQI